MGKQYLQIKYHPAKKEIEFKRFEGKKEITIRNDSRLKPYMNKRGEFVLQDYGNEFFDDIARAFDKQREVEIQVITTQLDYEDFVQMVDYYNESVDARCKFLVKKISTLPDMNITYRQVCDYGREAIGILRSKRDELRNISSQKKEVVESAKRFAEQIEAEAQNISSKIDALEDNTVNLCFTGAYSAGKSALINAVLGYRILPEKISSKTAKMFRIASPLDGIVVIEFWLLSNHAKISWNGKTMGFEFEEGPTESDLRAGIQEVLNDVRDSSLPQHVQLYKILEKLNGNPAVSDVIDIKFPISLDNENVRFTIYDTPGSDSDNPEHDAILNHAYKEQRQSILIFVNKPNSTEGTGKNALMQSIKDAELKDSKTSIDISRSLFVINWSDSLTRQQRIDLQRSEIEFKPRQNGNETDGSSSLESSFEPFTVKLGDKKLFFTAANYGYAAMAVRNGIANEEEKFMAGAGGKVLLSTEQSPMSFCYKQDRIASSEFATTKLIEHCDEEYAKASESGDETRCIEITSGMYALKHEILRHGEKYASAVKAYSIIHSVDMALKALNSRADSLREDSNKEISRIEQDIKELRYTISTAIDEASDEILIAEGDTFPNEELKILTLDHDSIYSLTSKEIKKETDKHFKGWFFGHGKIIVKNEDEIAFKKMVKSKLDSYTRNFLEKRKSRLEEKQSELLKKVKLAIKENGEISDSAKDRFDIPPHNIKSNIQISNIGSIYNNSKYPVKFFFIDIWSIDKEQLKQEIEGALTDIINDISTNYRKDYSDSLNGLVNEIRNDYETHLNDYSLEMRGLEADREAMKKLADKISEAADVLVNAKHNLDVVIWREEDD